MSSAQAKTTSPNVNPVNEQPHCIVEEAPQPSAASPAAVRSAPTAVFLAAGLGALGAAIVGGIVAGILKCITKKKSVPVKALEQADPMTCEPCVTAAVSEPTVPAVQPAGMGLDLSPFGSPVGSTPVRLLPVHKPEKMRSRGAMDSDADDQSDNSSVRDQRQSLIDAAQLQKTLKQMHEMAEENRKLSVFLAEYKADAEKLSRLEEENRALHDVTRKLEVELRDLKTNTLPRTGAELEVFKNAVRVPTIARSVCSNDETVLGVSTASVDVIIPDARVRRNGVFKQLLTALQGTANTSASYPDTPRSSVGGGVAATVGGGSTAGSSRTQRRHAAPGPEEAAVIGQAVYQLLDQFGGRMM